MLTPRVGGGISPGDITAQPAPSNTDYDEFVYELRRNSMRHTSASMHAYDFTCGCELCVALPTIRAMAAELAAARAEAEQGVRMYTACHENRMKETARADKAEREAEQLREDVRGNLYLWDVGELDDVDALNAIRAALAEAACAEPHDENCWIACPHPTPPEAAPEETP